MPIFGKVDITNLAGTLFTLSSEERGYRVNFSDGQASTFTALISDPDGTFRGRYEAGSKVEVYADSTATAARSLYLSLVSLCVDPWRDCERRYEPHFYDSMIDRSLPMDQVVMVLSEGTKIPLTEKGSDGAQDHEVRWNRWILIVTLRPCRIVLHTAYRE